MADHRDPGLAHILLLSAQLVVEAGELHDAGAVDRATVDLVGSALAKSTPDAGYAHLVGAYRLARTRLATALDAGYHLAAGYDSMADFWVDAEAQEQGRSVRTYWDSYEHGLRRRLERLLATAFGSTEAVLVNSGMSALDVALRSVGLRPGDVVLAHERAYFETDDYLDNVLAATGVTVTRADLTDPARVAVALGREPAAILVESVLNGPTCDVPVLEPLLASGRPVVLDNSVLSHGMPGRLLDGHPSPVLVVESGSKYLSRQASSGVVYGWGDLGGQARLTARRVGQQLQGRALHRLRAGEITYCGHRVAAHTAHVRQFAAALDGDRLTVSHAGTGVAGRDDLLAGPIRDGYGGCLLFVSLTAADRDDDRAHRALVGRWPAETGRPVRAGFGWTTTSGRSYGRDALNTAAGRSFIRLSAGLEPAPVRQGIAATFTSIADQWTETTA